MREESEFESRLYDTTHQVLREFLPDNMDPDPHRCASCGSQVYHPETNSEDLYLTVRLPPETAHLMENSASVQLPDETASIKLQFCDNHWAAIKEWIGNPNIVSFSSFDLKYTVPEVRTGLQTSERWNQNRLRFARAKMGNDHEPESNSERFDVNERLEATLLIAAVDRYEIDYGPTQQGIHRLVQEFSERGLNAEYLRRPFVDVLIDFGENEQSAIGTVFSTKTTTETHSRGPLSDWEAEPERVISDTVYYPLSQNTFHETAYDQFPDHNYVGFYWIEDREEWLWYPFEREYESGFNSTNRTQLPLIGPTGSSPALDLDALSASMLNTQAYEDMVRKNWENIERDRPWLDRFRDSLIRKLI